VVDGFLGLSPLFLREHSGIRARGKGFRRIPAFEGYSIRPLIPPRPVFGNDRNRRSTIDFTARMSVKEYRL
jgi:hypothetical protein